MVWGRNKHIIILPSILLVAGTGMTNSQLSSVVVAYHNLVLGYVSEGTMSSKLKVYWPGYVWTIVAMNILTTLMTGEYSYFALYCGTLQGDSFCVAGRIVWVTSQAQAIINKRTQRRYNTAVAIM